MTRHSAEDWKARALYEEGRRKQVEDELVRIRDEINRLLFAAARSEGLDGVLVESLVNPDARHSAGRHLALASAP
jgi:hypothetical protein